MMLQRFGEHIRGWFAGVVIAVIAVAFVAWGLEYYIDSNQAGDSAIAVVQGIKITQSEFSNQLQLAQRQQEQSLGRVLSDDELLFLKKMLLNQMISRLILTTALKQSGFTVSVADMEAGVAQMPQFQVNGVFSPDRLQQVIYQMGYSSLDAFFDFLRDTALTQQLIAGIRGTAFVLPSELKAAYELWQQKRDISFAVLPMTAFVAQSSVSPEQVAQYYRDNQNQFMVPAQVQVSYLLLSPQVISQTVKVTDAYIARYYQDNAANFMTPVSWNVARVTAKTPVELNTILKQIHAGKTLLDFHPVVQSIDAAQASPGLLTLLNTLTVHQISEPVSTPDGMTLVEILSKTKPRLKPLSEVHDQIKTLLIAQQVNQQFAAKSTQLSDLTYTNPTTLEPAAKQLGLVIQTSDWLAAQSKPAEGVFAEPQVLSAVFSHDVLTAGNNSRPISLKDGSLVVLRVAKQVAAHAKPLNAVAAEITTVLKTQMALRQTGLETYRFLSQLNKGQAVPSLHWQSRTQVVRSDASLDAAILQSAFSASLNQFTTVQLKNGYAIIKVTAVYPGDWHQATLAQKNKLTNSLTALVSQNEFQLYAQSLMKRAKVVINDKSLAGSWQQ